MHSFYHIYIGVHKNDKLFAEELITAASPRQFQSLVCFLLHFLLIVLLSHPVQLLQITRRDVLILVWAPLCFSRTNQTGSSTSNTFSNMQSGYSSGNYNRY